MNIDSSSTNSPNIYKITPKQLSCRYEEQLDQAFRDDYYNNKNIEIFINLINENKKKVEGMDNIDDRAHFLYDEYAKEKVDQVVEVLDKELGLNLASIKRTLLKDAEYTIHHSGILFEKSVADALRRVFPKQIPQDYEPDLHSFKTHNS